MLKNFGIFILLAIPLIGCGSGKDSGSSTNPVIKNSKAYNPGFINLYGDSIARGLGASSPQKSLEGCLSRAANEFVINSAVQGATSADGVAALPKTINEKSALVVISLGGNDIFVDYADGSLPEEKTLKNMRAIFKAFTQSKSLVLYLGLNPPPYPGVQIDTSRLKKINQIAREEGVIYIEDTLKGLWGNPDFMSDEVHPNDKGYAVVCERVLKALQPHFNLK